MNQCTRIISEYSEEVVCVVQGLLVYSNLCVFMSTWMCVCVSGHDFSHTNS